MQRILKDGIRDFPDEPEWGLGELRSVPQTEEELEVGEELEKGLEEGLWEELPECEVEELLGNGYMISSAFTHWEERDRVRQGRFVQSFKRLSTWWKGASVRMESVPEFASTLKQGDHLISFDIKSGYRHFYLHKEVRNFFLFKYDGRYFRCIALPFGWSRSPYLFINLLRPVVKKLRTEKGYRMLGIDDFVIAPSKDQASTVGDCEEASAYVDWLLHQLGVKRHPVKGVWGAGVQELDHLGVHWDTARMRFTITEAKRERGSVA